MSVQGSLATMSAQDLFDWIDRRGLAGEVSIERTRPDEMSRKFAVAFSHLTNASSSNPAEYLGQMLINGGHLDEATLSQLYEAQESTGMSLGKLLTSRNIVSDAVLTETLQTKIREGFYDALSWTDGSFQFVPDTKGQARRDEHGVLVSIRSCLVEGAARAEQWKAVRQIVPDDETRFTITDPVWLTKVKPGSPSGLLLGDVHKGLAVREIIRERRTLAFPVVQRLAELDQRGVLAVDDRPRPTAPVEERSAEPPPPPSERPGTPVPTLEGPFLLEEAKNRARAGDARGALEAAKGALRATPASAEAQRVYQEMERRLFAELSRALLTRFRVPKLLLKAHEVKSLQLSEEERYLVGRIDGRWDLLSLMRVSSLREVEALITLQRLAERGVISLE